jgi:hypothetical protein
LLETIIPDTTVIDYFSTFLEVETMSDSFDLTKLDHNTFEHLVNSIAIRILGFGHTGFCPGADGGRDGYFEGEAPYPSHTDRWSGRWYIQCKFHKPHLSTDPQKWLLEEIKKEIKEFNNPEKRRTWPDVWIIATNIDQSGMPNTGSFDKALAIVKKARPSLEKKFHVWGGSKIITYLNQFPDIRDRYRHFITPGHVISELYDQIRETRAELETILNYLIGRQLWEQQHTKLDQAGASIDVRPGIHKLFIDLPFKAAEYNIESNTLWCVSRICDDIQVPATCQVYDIRRFSSISGS